MGRSLPEEFPVVQLHCPHAISNLEDDGVQDGTKKVFVARDALVAGLGGDLADLLTAQALSRRGHHNAVAATAPCSIQYRASQYQHNTFIATLASYGTQRDS